MWPQPPRPWPPPLAAWPTLAVAVCNSEQGVWPSVSSTVSSISVCSHGKMETAAVNVIISVYYFRYLISNGSHHSTSTDIYREDWLITCLDIAVFASFCMQVRKCISSSLECCFQFFFQILVNTLLIVGALRRISSHLFPWLCVTASCIIIVMVSVSITEDVILIHHHPYSSIGDADLHTLLRDEQARAGVLPVHSLADGDGPGAGPQLLLLAHGVCVQEEFASRSENAGVRWRRNYSFLHTFHNISLF